MNRTIEQINVQLNINNSTIKESEMVTTIINNKHNQQTTMNNQINLNQKKRITNMTNRNENTKEKFNGNESLVKALITNRYNMVIHRNAKKSQYPVPLPVMLLLLDT